ncbi:hypothetical protein [Erythrobacter sp. MTPC3]|uniref:hypothetical protein n=1 Tax=Erythrobacter sp. MTPC3 TaxID=3056564 RepID=UPI0036F1B950
MTGGIVGSPLGKARVGRAWRALFWCAAVFNWIMGPAATIDARITGLLVFSFGIIFALIARDPDRYGAALWAGLIGKIGTVALLAPALFETGNSALAGAVLAAEALLGAGFLAFLLTRSDD